MSCNQIRTVFAVISLIWNLGMMTKEIYSYSYFEDYKKIIISFKKTINLYHSPTYIFSRSNSLKNVLIENLKKCLIFHKC